MLKMFTSSEQPKLQKQLSNKPPEGKEKNWRITSILSCTYTISHLLGIPPRGTQAKHRAPRAPESRSLFFQHDCKCIPEALSWLLAYEMTMQVNADQATSHCCEEKPP